MVEGYANQSSPPEFIHRVAVWMNIENRLSSIKIIWMRSLAF